MTETFQDRIWLRLMELGAGYGCHQMPERSFTYHGYQFPLCARCTGIVISTLATYLVFPRKRLSWGISAAMGSTVWIDGLIQYLGIKPSTNRRRFITGCMGGFGCTMLRLKLYSCLFNHLRSNWNRERK